MVCFLGDDALNDVLLKWLNQNKYSDAKATDRYSDSERNRTGDTGHWRTKGQLVQNMGDF